MAGVANAVSNSIVEDDDQWLYGDEKDSKQNGEVTNEDEGSKSGLPDSQEATRTADDSGTSKGSAEQTEPASEGDKSRDDDAEESSDEDDVTVTIGELKKGPDIIQGSGHQPRFQPKTTPGSGLRDEDFTGVGKINGVAAFDFTLTDLEEKPWRKPGADLSDYFNYGFNEESWFKYCERQKRMRVSESGAGLSGLGINISKPYGSGSTHVQPSGTKSFKAGVPRRGAENSTEGETKTEGNTIQVMTADRREYSCKVMNQHQHMSHSRTYDDMDFGGNPYGSSYYSTPPPYFATPPPPYGQWSQPPPPINVPPPAAPWTGTPTSALPPPPPPIPPPVSLAAQPPVVYHSEDSMSSRVSVDPDEDRYRSRRGHRDRERSRDRDRDRRSVSKTPSSRHRRRSRSRTPSPSHRHKRKKSKRDRDDD